MIGLPAPVPVVDDEVGPERGSNVWRQLRRNPAFWMGAIGVLVIVGLAIMAPVVAPYDPLFQFRGDGLTPGGDPLGPTARFPLGTDKLGRDELSQIIFGARTSLLVGIVGALSATLIGVAVGTTAGYLGDRSSSVRVRGRHGFTLPIPVESLLMRFTDVVLSFPILLLAIALVAIVGSSVNLVVVLVAAFLWTTVARIVYSRVRSLRDADFIYAARALGAGDRRIVGRHVLPHLTSIVIVYATLGIGTAILFEATLSFLGIGVPAPTPSWGSMIFEHIGYYTADPRVVILPGLAIMLTILAFNLLGDALADGIRSPPLALATSEQARSHTGGKA